MENLAAALGSRSIYTVSAQAVSRVLESGDPDAARLLLYIMQEQERFDRVRAMRALKLDAQRYAAAMAVIREPKDETPEQLTLTDILSAPQGAAPAASTAHVMTPPTYTRTELAEAMKDGDFAYLCTQSEQAVGHPLRQYEMSALMMMYDYLRLPADVIALLINHVRQECERRSTPEQPSSVSFRDIRAEAVRWHERGVTSAAAAERYIESENQRNSAMGQAFRLLGIRGRTPSPTERRYTEQFLELDPGMELIALAYDRTVTKKGSLVWPYMASILRSWHEKGYVTPDDVEAGERSPRGAVPAQDDGPGDQYDERVLNFFRQNGKEGE